jgi:anti-sigma B factor antagonist
MRLADVQLSHTDGAIVATVVGEVDMSNASELQRALADGTPNSVLGLILDLSRLDYLDSAGIQLLLKLHGALRTRAQALVLVVPGDSIVADTFRLAGLADRLHSRSTQDDALSLLHSLSAGTA